MVTMGTAAWLIGASPDAPPTRREDVVDILHGVEVPDPYRWLEAQQSSETRAWIDSQIAYTDSVMSGVAGVSDLRERLRALIAVDRVDTPAIRSGWYFLHKRSAAQQHAVFCVREGRDGDYAGLPDVAGWHATRGPRVEGWV